MYVKATVLSHLNAEPSLAFLDSGAEVNLMTWAFAQQHGITKLKPVTVTLTGITSAKLEPMGEADVSLNIEDSRGQAKTQLVPFVVVRSANKPFLLGFPWHAQGEPICNYNAKTWRWALSPAKLEIVTPEDFYLDLKDKANCFAVDYKHSPRPITLDEMVSGRSAFINAVDLAEVEDSDSDSTPNPEPSPPQRLPDYLQDYAEVFDNENASLLPSNGKMDHAIETVDNQDPPYGPLYNLSTPELAVLRDYIDESLQKGWIRRSTSPSGAPILFVPKKDGGLRLCVDYRGLNKITIKNRTALPLISETLDRLVGAAIFTKFDLKDAYHRIRIKEGHEWKTAFRTRYGHFEYLVMPFGLANAPATFQSYINQALIGLVDTICVIYLDDILIYSKTVEEHHHAVRQVLDRLRQFKLYCNLKKCEFDTDRVDFLGFQVSTEGVGMEPSRVRSIKEWPEPKTFRELQVFLGFANFYRRFILQYSKVVAPLTNMLKGMQEGKKTGPFAFEQPQREAFETLKKAFTSAGVLVHFDPQKPIMIETDASGFAIGAVLSQQHTDAAHPTNQHWKPVAYYSRKMIPAENNYETHDQELLAIVAAFKQWRHYLEGSAHTVLVKTDHNSLRYFMTKKDLNRRQARWAERLSAFDFEIVYRTGKSNPADGPSRRPDYELPKDAVSSLLPTLQNKLRSVYMTQAHTFSGKDAGRQRRVFAAYMEGSAPLLAQPLRRVCQKVQGDAATVCQVERLPITAQRSERNPFEIPYGKRCDGEQWTHESIKLPRSAGLLSRHANMIEIATEDELLAYDSDSGESVAEDDDSPNIDTPTSLIPRSLLRVATEGMDAYKPPTESLSKIIGNAQRAEGWVNAPVFKKAQRGKTEKSKEGLWMLDGKIILPPVEALRQEVISICHDDPHSSHFGHAKTTELVRRNFWWEGLGEDVKRYVKTCSTCQFTKVSRHSPYGELASLPRPSGPWQELSMDFITDLPPSKDTEGAAYDSILVIMDRYTKMALYIPTRKTVTAEELAQLFVHRVVRSYGIPRGIVSDRGAVFTSNFWSGLCYNLGVKRRLSTAFHPQTDGQTERQNQTLEHYLRCYCNYRQNDWVSKLALAEFTYNNSVHSTIGTSPFYALYGFHAEIPLVSKEPTENAPRVPAADERAALLLAERQELDKKWDQALAAQEKYYNKRHTPKKFNVGDKVILLAKNLSQLRPNKKLADQYLGPFEVDSLVGSHGQAYRLKLPPTYKIHPVFHVSLLEEFHQRPGSKPIEPAEIGVDGEAEWEVEAILAHRDRNKPKRREYLVRWKGFTPADDSWEPLENFGTTDIVEEYERIVTRDNIAAQQPQRKRRSTRQGTRQQPKAG